MTALINEGYTQYGVETWDDASSPLLIGHPGSNTDPYRTYLQFDLPIERGKLLASATLTVNITDLNGASTVSLGTSAKDYDDATWPTSYAEALALVNTGASASNETATVIGTVSFDVKNMVQEVINRSGWVSGNNIIFHVTGNASGFATVELERGTATLSFTYGNPTATLTEDAYFGGYYIFVDFDESFTYLLDGPNGSHDIFGSPYNEQWAPVIRFAVNIMPGAVVPPAYLQLYVISKTSGSDITLSIKANDVDSAAWISGADVIAKYSDVTGRTLTTASMSHTVKDSDVDHIVNIDVTSIVQEIVDRVGWTGSSGSNYILFIGSPTSGIVNLVNYASSRHSTYAAPRLVFIDPDANNASTLAWMMINK